MSGRSRDHSPQGGAWRRANLPYLVASVVSVVVLVGYLAWGQPFAAPGSAANAITTSATTIPAATSVATTAGAGTSTTAAAGTVLLGEEIFNATCIACHGLGGVGVPGLGKPLTTSTFAAGLSDDDLLAFLIAGRSDTDPLNTTGIAMPARGGNASLTDDDLRAVVAYLRTLAS